MKKIVLIISLLMILYPTLVYSWNGYAYDTDNYVEIDNQDSVKPGADVKIYDYSDNSYHNVYVISVDRNGTVTIDVFDYDTGDYRIFEMIEEGSEQETV
jgi:hypothetical protein